MVNQANQPSSNQPELTLNDPQRRHLGWLLVSLVFMGLACGVFRPNVEPTATRITTRTPLPTFTPTPNPAAIAAVPAQVHHPAANPIPPAGDNPVAVVTNTPRPTFTPTTNAPLAAGQPTELATSSPNPPDPVEANPNPTPTPNPGGPPVNPPTPVSADTPTSTLTPVSEVSVPTATPTTTPVSVNTPVAATPTETATPTVEATIGAASSPTPQSGANGWSFASVKVYPDLFEDSLVLYGEMINNTGSTQLIDYVTGTFYNDQGQVIADDANTLDDWPVETVPSGGRVPFVMTVEDINSAARFDLRVEAEPGAENPRQNFEFLNKTGGYDNDLYCVQAELRNPGGALANYLTITAIIFDASDQVINYNTHDEFFPEDIVGSETLKFEICIEQPNQNAARFDLRAWGE